MVLRLLQRSPSAPPPAQNGAAEGAPRLSGPELAKDPAATRKLLQRVAPRVARAVYATLGASSSDSEDVVQLSLIAFIQALPAFRGDCSPESYACTIAVRTALAARRRASVERNRSHAEVEPDDTVSDDVAPSDEALSTERREIFRKLMDRLPEVQAETFMLRVVLGWSLEEVAEATNAPLNTVRSRMRLAKDALRAMIENDPSLVEALEVTS
ncbi:MAG TPA: RNA polymerase sigma factor [Polyangiaceae bacterium]